MSNTLVAQGDAAATSPDYEQTLPAGEGEDEAPLLLRDPLVVDFVTSADARRARSLDLKLTKFKPEYAGAARRGWRRGRPAGRHPRRSPQVGFGGTRV